MRVAVLHPQTAFVRGGAETHAESLVKALKAAGHDADLVQIAGKWYPPSQLAHQMAVWRSFDITESNGLKVDAVIGLKFPAYLAQHERKVVWLIHQHRTAYELWDHADYADLKRQDDGAAVRDMVWEADRVALGEAKRVFTNSSNVKDRLWNSLRIPAETLYHPSGVSERLLDREPGPYGEHILFPSRMESLKRQSLVIDAMKHVKTSVQLVLVGRGPDEPQLREQVERLGVGDRVTFEIGVSDERLEQLYLSALGVYFGPFDEDYGYVTLEGMAARTTGRHAHRQRGTARVRAGRRDRDRRPAGAAGDRRGLRPAAPRPGGRRPVGQGRQRVDPGRGAALAGRRRAAPGLMGARAKAAGVSRRLRSPKAVQVEHGTGPGSAGELVFCGPLPPAPTGIATYDRAVLDGLRADRVQRAPPHGRAVADRTEGRDQVPRLSPGHLPARQQRGVPPGDLPRRVPHQRVDRAARPRARRLRARVEDGRRPAGVHGGARGRAAPREPHLARRDPQRTVAGTVGRPRRQTRARDHRALGVLQGLPGGSRLPHAGLRGAASGGGVAAGVRAGRRARSRPARPVGSARCPPPDRRAGRHERGQAARCPRGGRDPASRRCARRDRGPAHRGLRRRARGRRREGRAIG